MVALRCPICGIDANEMDLKPNRALDDLVSTYVPSLRWVYHFADWSPETDSIANPSTPQGTGDDTLIKTD